MRSVRKTMLMAFIALLPLMAHGDETQSGEEVRIGVLAHRGPEAAVQAWTPTAEYLNRTVPGRTFRVVPLNNITLDEAVAAGSVDFVITNPGSYAILEATYGVTRILTLRNLRQDGVYTQFGAVIFTRADRDDIETLRDLRGKSFMAVRADAFGGYLMALREFREAGIRPERDFTRIQYVGLPQDQIVLAVAAGEVDAGTVRTDTLERMAADGLVRMDRFKVINRRQVTGFPFLLSTGLYPEWAFARSAHVPEQLAHQVGMALLQLAPDSPETRASQSAGWTMPLDYTPVHELLRELRIGPYADLDRIDLETLLRHFWHWLLLLFGLFVVVSMVAAYIMRINRRLSHSQAQLLELAGALEESNRVLQEMSVKDGLTGLANHRHFEEVLAREWARSERQDMPLSLLMVDIDHFKRHNDRYGHLAGDQCLRQLAAVLHSAVQRPADLPARFGGEEFVVVLPETGTDGAQIVAERIREMVSRLTLEACEGQPRPHVTVSVGVATRVPRDALTPERLIAAADAALYRAKDAGRNCVMAHETGDEPPGLRQPSPA
ncbi:hypothetical protein B1C78_15790 [Thioalkalivibrio denitrificans]|uniref:diguanylate cyclase n=1 Tax=Thioalkalivibrio denitrificans TaxID=108003 RepID=A0A1V3NA48_9GAMM|nr:diguanylate cyclase [Thioalkalivibrio denitrificans]OOG21977.1 hypothetical protein B1C78_15790 [Thioalkalivibrio denitrificans]